MDKNSSKPLKYCFCRSSFIYNTIQSFKTQILTIDTRASDYYSKYRIEGSINLNNDRVQRYFRTAQKPLEKGQLTSNDIQKMLTPEENKKYTERKKWFCLIITSENSLKSELLHELRALTEADEEVDSLSIQEDQFSGTLLTSIEKIKEEESVSLGLEIYQIFKKERVAEAHILIDGATHFFNRYPFMDQGYYTYIQALQSESKDWVPTKLEKLKDMPHDILDARLFLGDCIHSEHKELLSRFKISHIVNAAFECYNHHEKAGIKYLKLLVRDESDDRFARQFKEIYDFIHKALTESSEARVFVHCAMGKSRSAAVVIMYLMKRFSWSLRKAHSFVKAKRDRVSPYHGFIQELEVLEANDFQFEE